MEQRTILILTIQFGAGHHRAAQAVAESCRKEFPEFDAKVIDVTPLMPRWMRWVYVDLYLFVLKYVPFIWRYLEGIQREQARTFPAGLLRSVAVRLYNHIKSWNVSAIVTLEVGVNEIASILKAEYFPNTPLMAVLTDYDVDRAWVQSEVNLFCVGSAEVRAELLAMGVPSEKVALTGIPIDEQFLRSPAQGLALEKGGGDSSKLRILLAGGGEGLLKVKQLLRELDGIVNAAEVTVLVGMNQKLQRSLRKLERLKNIQLRIQGWTDEMPRFFHSHDLLISKPGGVTLTEAMAAGLPLLASFPLPGSEVKHCMWTEKWGIGLAAPTMEAFRIAATRLVRDEPLRRKLSETACRVYLEQHAHPIAEVLREHLRPRRSPSKELQIEFDEWARTGRGEQMEVHHGPFARTTLDRMQLASGERVLDLGCGTGWASRQMAGEVAQGSIVGIDISPEMIKRAVTHPSNPAHVSFLVASADALPFRENQFHKVFSCEAFYYCPDLQRALQEVVRVLAAGGKFYCLVNLFRENPYTHMWVKLLKVKAHLLGRVEYEKRFREAGFEDAVTSLIPDSTPVDETNFKPGWGVNTPGDLKKYREIGALLITGVKGR
ncbi:MAG: methyltransferase domain-containing protein [Terriglobia bacterium]